MLCKQPMRALICWARLRPFGRSERAYVRCHTFCMEPSVKCTGLSVLVCHWLTAHVERKEISVFLLHFVWEPG